MPSPDAITRQHSSGKVQHFTTGWPQAAYAAFTAGFRHKITYNDHIIRTIPNIKEQMKPLDEMIDCFHTVTGLTKNGTLCHISNNHIGT